MNKMAEVIGYFENGTAKVKFDGEETPSEKEYGFLRHYIPKIGDRVFMMEFNGSYIIFDAVDYQVPAQKPINQNYIKGNVVIEGDLTLKGGPKTVEATNGKFDNLNASNVNKNFEENKKIIEENKNAAKSAQDKADEAYQKASSASSAISGIRSDISSMKRDIFNLQLKVR